MKILIHTRNAALAEDFKTIVEEKLNSMERFSVVIDRVEVEVLHETNPHQGKHKHKVILTSHGSGPLLRAEAAEFNDLAAFDSAIKISRSRSGKFMSVQKIMTEQLLEK